MRPAHEMRRDRASGSMLLEQRARHANFILSHPLRFILKCLLIHSEAGLGRVGVVGDQGYIVGCDRQLHRAPQLAARLIAARAQHELDRRHELDCSAVRARVDAEHIGAEEGVDDAVVSDAEDVDRPLAAPVRRDRRDVAVVAVRARRGEQLLQRDEVTGPVPALKGLATQRWRSLAARSRRAPTLASSSLR